MNACLNPAAGRGTGSGGFKDDFCKQGEKRQPLPPSKAGPTEETQHFRDLDACKGPGNSCKEPNWEWDTPTLLSAVPCVNRLQPEPGAERHVLHSFRLSQGQTASPSDSRGHGRGAMGSPPLPKDPHLVGGPPANYLGGFRRRRKFKGSHEKKAGMSTRKG